MTNPHLTLYIGGTCRFCAKVLDFLQQHPMDIQIKDVWSDDNANQEMQALTGGRTQVPCLRMDDNYMHESLDIIEKLRAIQASQS